MARVRSSRRGRQGWSHSRPCRRRSVTLAPWQRNGHPHGQQRWLRHLHLWLQQQQQRRRRRQQQQWRRRRLYRLVWVRQQQRRQHQRRQLLYIFLRIQWRRRLRLQRRRCRPRWRRSGAQGRRCWRPLRRRCRRCDRCAPQWPTWQRYGGSPPLEASNILGGVLGSARLRSTISLSAVAQLALHAHNVCTCALNASSARTYHAALYRSLVV
mmetsp:Transcript_29236/g.73373  ORF Transcript_29236/g.73373 Transcript_29236/m.73373 type:complete len:211 (-) Transcript_29236:111-743(-)